MKRRCKERETAPLTRTTAITAREHCFEKDVVHKELTSRTSGTSKDVLAEGGISRSLGHTGATGVMLIGWNNCLLQHDGQSWQAFDDITGLALDATKVYGARLTEVAYVREMRVWTKIRRSEAKSQWVEYRERPLDRH